MLQFLLLFVYSKSMNKLNNTVGEETINLECVLAKSRYESVT